MSPEDESIEGGILSVHLKIVGILIYRLFFPALSFYEVLFVFSFELSFRVSFSV